MRYLRYWKEYRAVIVTALYLLAIAVVVAWNDGRFGGVDRLSVRTTAYTHTESDHLIYGRKSAAGSELRAGKINSAAADWSVFPLGTKFRIAGDDTVYEVDDYGGALVGTETIDIYRRSEEAMDDWGVREVEIEILKEGSVEKSIEILEDRTAHPVPRKILERLRAAEED